MSDSNFDKKLTRRKFLQTSAMVAAGSLLAAMPQPAGASAPAKAVNVIKRRTVRAAAGGNVMVGTVGDLSNMDPFMMSFVNYPMMENVYDQFVRLDNQVQPAPQLLTSPRLGYHVQRSQLHVVIDAAVALHAA